MASTLEQIGEVVGTMHQELDDKIDEIYSGIITINNSNLGAISEGIESVNKNIGGIAESIDKINNHNLWSSYEAIGTTNENVITMGHYLEDVINVNIKHIEDALGIGAYHINEKSDYKEIEDKFEEINTKFQDVNISLEKIGDGVDEIKSNFSGGFNLFYIANDYFNADDKDIYKKHLSEFCDFSYARINIKDGLDYAFISADSVLNGGRLNRESIVKIDSDKKVSLLFVLREPIGIVTFHAEFLNKSGKVEYEVKYDAEQGRFLDREDQRGLFSYIIISRDYSTMDVNHGGVFYRFIIIHVDNRPSGAWSSMKLEYTIAKVYE